MIVVMGCVFWEVCGYFDGVPSSANVVFGGQVEEGGSNRKPL